MIVFVDSGAHLGLLDAQDQHHEQAKACLKGLKGSRLITSTFVLDEVATRGADLVGAGATANYLNVVLSNPLYHVFEVNRGMFKEALAALVKYEDQGLSFTDCTSVVILRGARIRTIFTFDAGFRRIGFRSLP